MVVAAILFAEFASTIRTVFGVVSSGFELRAAVMTDEV
jgi:hypothetical protein